MPQKYGEIGKKLSLKPGLSLKIEFGVRLTQNAKPKTPVSLPPDSDTGLQPNFPQQS
ncbi:hypothetical protein [Siphonobacter sp. SORGH_AS_1065]|uniref:hypothetical protein n=1 Tax=Siphonobacter sp. SORGH_AS_1065 TaxID=3041795 RepID=UPI0012FF2189|nr:hypothetical protein [Siphonobacter sp. SORGH_AS_1065]MDQ1085717.1 hypothetical protein [Siphonobacter sp. SORGH_AS_1065]